MSKKKQQRNGFFYYMLDMQQDFKANGRIVPMRDMPIFAGPSWSKLSDAQKHRYNTRAKSNKDSGGGGGGQEGLPAAASMVDTAAAGRRDCSGSLISVSLCKWEHVAMTMMIISSVAGMLWGVEEVLSREEVLLTWGSST